MVNEKVGMKKSKMSILLKHPLFWFAAVFAVAVVFGTAILKKSPSLPVYQPSDLNPALVDPNSWSAENHRISDFQLINQFGDSVSLASVEGEVLIADFFFTRCATICPIMTTNLTQVMKELSEWEGWRILSHSVTPAADSPEVLLEYADRMGARHHRWWFLTGEKKEIYRLARRSYFACYDEANGGDGGLQDFVHTENIVLVDARGRLRGFYDGTSEESINQLIEDAKILLEKKD